MAESPFSSAQQARRILADRLAGLCRDAGLTGREIAMRCGWHPSKSSRIMNARTPPSAGDIRAWCRACGAEDQTADLLASLRNAEGMWIPTGSDRSRMPVEEFWIFDAAQTNVELVSGYLTITQPGEVTMYAEAFAELATLAVHGASARALVASARDALE
ncbi:helix-turn-helix domain-containing protein [Streptomyces anulatus]|uniref:helix-turn-helix domain-containing protein n=1 Tax=Streptomyces anulatus TaxID=1892 RepID=UPI0033EED92A